MDVELTQKEFNVAYLYSQGRRMREVAQQNHLSINTCRERLQSVYRKIGVNNAFDLHLWFLWQPI